MALSSRGRSELVARSGVIVAQLGGPERLQDVEGFIRSIFNDPHLVPLPFGQRTRSLMSSIIARARAGRVRSRYELIGGGSPILATTQHQADALSTELEARGHDAVVAVAHRHSLPDTSSAVDTMLNAAVDRIILLPLFPQYSTTTTGSSEAELRRLLAIRAPHIELQVIRSWCDHPSYVNLQARLVEDMLGQLKVEDEDRALLVFSAHGLPQRIVDRGDPYLEEVEASVAEVVKQLPRSVDHVIAFQSRAGPLFWLVPDVTEIVESAAADGRTFLGIVPISFVSDHLETLHELDIDLRSHASAAGIHDFHRSRCLDTDPAVGSVLADIVEESL